MLRGKLSIKAAGWPVSIVEKGRAVVHPIKYYIRLIPEHAQQFADVLTIII